MNRIAMLIPTLDQIGGAERQVLLLAKELSQRGWQITVVSVVRTAPGVSFGSGRNGSAASAETIVIAKMATE